MAEVQAGVKVVLLGDNNVAKTRLVERYMYDRYSRGIVPTTIGAAYAARFETVGDKKLLLKILDAAGSERYVDMARIYARNADAAVICFDLTNRASLDMAKFWIKDLMKNEKRCRIYFCITKSDIVTDEMRKILGEYQTLTDLIHEVGGDIFETSNKTGKNIKELFQKIALDYLTGPEYNEKSGVPEVLHELGPEYVAAYRRACIEGSDVINQTRVMLVGQFGTGKTSTKRRLLEEQFEPVHVKTNGIETTLSSCNVEIDTALNWHRLGKDDEGRHEEYAKGVARFTYNLLQQQLQAQVPDDSIVAPKTNTGILTRIKSWLSSTRKDSNLPHQDGARVHVTEETVAKAVAKEANISQGSEIPAEVKEHLFNLKDGDAESESKTTAEKFVIWDFGGQAVFYTTHMVFLTYRAIYLAVLDITIPLETPICTYRQGRHQKVLDRSSPQSVAEFLDYWLNCIYTHGMRDEPNPVPSVIIVLTHKDEILKTYPETAAEEIEKFKTTVHKHIEGKAYCSYIHHRVFAIANNDENDTEVNELRSAITDLAKNQPYSEDKIPIPWLGLRLKLKELGEEGKKVTDLKTVVTLAKGFEIPEEGVCKVLDFYNAMGDIVFFSDNDLQDFVVLDPQWLVDMFSRVITLKEFADQVTFKDSTCHWEKLEEDGVLHQIILDSVWNKEYANHLITLMLKFHLILPMRLCNHTHLYGELDDPAKYFLIPSLLAPVDETEKVPEGPIPSIVLAFNGKFIPIGIASHLFSALVCEEGWTLLNKIFKDHAAFLPAGIDSDIVITVKQSPGQLEIHGGFLPGGDSVMDAAEHLFLPYLQQVLAQLQAIVKVTCPKASFYLAVWCSCIVNKPTERVLVSVGKAGACITDKKSLLCHKHQQKFSTSKLSPWFKVASSGKIPCAGSITSEKSLKEVASQLGIDWRRLGYHLVGHQTVESLSTPAQGGPELYPYRMLIKWHQGLDHMDRSLDAVKEKLVLVLEEEERGDLARIVRQFIGTNENELFLEVSRGLILVWQHIGIRLGVSQNVRDAIKAVQVTEYDPGFKMLLQWRNQTEDGHKLKLISTLRDIQRNDIIEYLESGSPQNTRDAIPLSEPIDMLTAGQEDGM